MIFAQDSADSGESFVCKKCVYKLVCGSATSEKPAFLNLINFLCRLFSKLRHRDCDAILPWKKKMQPHCRSEDFRQALLARIEDVFESCLHLW